MTASSSSSSSYLKIIASLAVPLAFASMYIFIKRIRNRSRKKSSSFSLPRIGSKKKIFEVLDDQQGMYTIEGGPRPSHWNSLGLEQPLVIAMVGLPARGKSYIVKMLIRYLTWTGFECEVFNVGSYRRQIGHQSADSSFFDMTNQNATKLREEMAMQVQEDMYAWLRVENLMKRRVAIFDATNTTKARRYALAQKARKENVLLLFVESMCDDQNVLARNYELKLQNDDYKGMDKDKAMKDFISRVKAYEQVYETIEDYEDNHQISYIKLINVGQKVITRYCHGYLPSQVAFYLQNVHIQPRKIYLTLNAENLDFAEDSMRLGGAESGKLTDAGRQYSLDLAKFIQRKQESLKDLGREVLGREVLVLAGTARVHAETVLHLRMVYSCYNTPFLNELRGGDLHGYSREEIKKLYPLIAQKREADKLNYRYPGVGGESYLDVIERIRPVIIELERQRRSVVIVCHLAVLRCIHGYFMGTKAEQIPYKQFKRHYVYELTIGPFGCTSCELKPSDELQHMI